MPDGTELPPRGNRLHAGAEVRYRSARRKTQASFQLQKRTAQDYKAPVPSENQKILRLCLFRPASREKERGAGGEKPDSGRFRHGDCHACPSAIGERETVLDGPVTVVVLAGIGIGVV